MQLLCPVYITNREFGKSQYVICFSFPCPFNVKDNETVEGTTVDLRLYILQTLLASAVAPRVLVVGDLPRAKARGFLFH